MTLVRHAFTGLLGSAAPLVAALVTVPLYLELLQPVRYGVFVVFLALLNYASFFDCGMGKTLAYLLAGGGGKRDQSSKELVWSALLISTAMSLLVGVAMLLSGDRLHHLVSTDFQEASEWLAALLWAAATLPFVSAIALLTGALQGVRRFHQLNFVTGVSGVALQCLPLLACYLVAPRVDVAMMAAFAVRLLTVIGLYLSLRVRLNPIGRPPQLRASAKMLLSHGSWFFAVTVLTSIIGTGDKLLVSGVLGAEAVARYSVPFDIATRLTIIAAVISSTMFPSLVAGSNLSHQMIARAGGTAIALFTPFVLVGVLAFHPFLTLWVGSRAALASRHIGELILIGAWVNVITGICQARLLAEGRVRLVTGYYLVQFVVYGIALYLVLTTWGIIGCAILWSARGLIDAGLTMWASGDARGLTAPLLRYGSLLLVAELIAFGDSGLIVRGAAIVVLGCVSTWMSRDAVVLVLKRLAGR